MTLTYNDIARWIEPVAEKACGGRHLSLGGMALRLSVAEEWEADCGNDEQVEADLACAELVRRLNEHKPDGIDWPYGVLIEKGRVNFFDKDGEGVDRPYTTHPLEAVARFAREVGA